MKKSKWHPKSLFNKIAIDVLVVTILIFFILTLVCAIKVDVLKNELKVKVNQILALNKNLQVKQKMIDYRNIKIAGLKNEIKNQEDQIVNLKEKMEINIVIRDNRIRQMTDEITGLKRELEETDKSFVSYITNDLKGEMK